jgi:uncharacterized repeat protein (TIGR01451 family)
VRLTTTQDFYYPGVITSAIELYAPKIGVTKTVEDVNGGDVIAGDVLRYSITVTNAADALDAAVGVILDDVIPTDTTYVPGTLVIAAGVNAGLKTDAVDDDQGEFLVGSNAVRFQLGSGAGGGVGTPVGGTLVAGQSTTVTFDVIVNANVLGGTVIGNSAMVDFEADTGGFLLAANSNMVEVTCRPSADLAITKTDGALTATPGTAITYTIVATNAGPDGVTGATVQDVFGPELTSVSWVATYAGGASGPASGGGALAATVNLPKFATATFTVSAVIAGTAIGTLSNTATVTVPPGVVERDPSNNSATDTTLLKPQADLNVVKTRTSVAPVAGETVTYLITVTNQGPSTISGFTLTDSTAPLLSGATFGTPSAGSYNPGTGAWTGLTLATGQFVTITLTGTVPGAASGKPGEHGDGSAAIRRDRSRPDGQHLDGDRPTRPGERSQRPQDAHER